MNEVTRERTQSFLTDDHIDRIVAAYRKFKDESGFARVATPEQIRGKDANLSIPLYVAPAVDAVQEEAGRYNDGSLAEALADWLESSQQVRQALDALLCPPAKKKKVRR